MKELIERLSEHFPYGMRFKKGRIATTNELVSMGVHCDCHCGESFVGSDEQEARYLWAEHAALRSKQANAQETEHG